MRATAVGIIALAISAIGSATPSFWSDEVATIRAARLPLSVLFTFVQHKDAVHAAYYSVMHIWIGAFGQSEFAIRSFSSLAIGIAAAGLVVLGSSMWDERFGITAGVVFAILPRTTYMGAEGRSYALSTALAIWFTIALVSAAKRNRARDWILYAALGTVSFYTFIYLLLLLPVHLVVLTRIARVRKSRLSWLVSGGIAVLTAVPILLLAHDQKSQLAWLNTEPVVDVWTILVEPFFDSSWPTAVVTILIVCGAVVAVARRFPIGSKPALVLAIAWCTIPLCLLLLANAVDGPLYLARYLSFSTPGIALLLACASGLHRSQWAPASLVVVIALAAAPIYVSQRSEDAKGDRSDLRQVAEYIDTHATAGDGIFFTETGPTVNRPRLALYAYPLAFAHLDDIGFRASFATDKHWTFADRTTTLPIALQRSSGFRRLWVITPTTHAPCKASLQGQTVSNPFVLRRQASTDRETICEYAADHNTDAPARGVLPRAVERPNGRTS